jgi:hypothetical protein
MKHIKIFSLLSLAMVLGFAASAQNDVVRLKDGSMIRGTIIEYIVGDHVRIKTLEGNVYEYKADQLQTTRMGDTKTFEAKTKGYYNITGIGFTIGQGSYGPSAGVNLHTINGYQWNSHLMTGIGAGIEYLKNQAQIPLFVDARWNLLKGNFTPVVGAMAGYSLALGGNRYYDWYNGQQDKNYGGLTGGLKFGFRAQAGPHFAFTMDMGYRMQLWRAQVNRYFWNGIEGIYYPTIERTTMHRVTLNLGFMFN